MGIEKIYVSPEAFTKQEYILARTFHFEEELGIDGEIFVWFGFFPNLSFLYDVLSSFYSYGLADGFLRWVELGVEE